MGGQIIIVDEQWKSHISHKISDDSGLSLIVSIGLTFQQQSITIIKIMVPSSLQGQYTMWSRIKKYLNDKGINKKPRDYVLNTASKWQINELAKEKKVIIMGDFNRTYTQLAVWQNENNLQRIHEKMERGLFPLKDFSKVLNFFFKKMLFSYRIFFLEALRDF